MEAPGLSPPGPEREPVAGWISPEVSEEFPGLRLLRLDLEASPGRASRDLRARLRHLSDRFRGAQAVAMRQQPIPWAYRVFYRHVGLDPDADRTPVEAAAVERLLRGAFKARDRLDAALLVSLVETGVPIWALDSTRITGRLGIRLAGDDERLGRDPNALEVTRDRLVVADEEGPLAVLFGDLAPGHGVTSATTRMTLFSVQVAGVPEIHVEEALWQCATMLTGD